MDKKEYLKIKDKQKKILSKISLLNKELKSLEDKEADLIARQVQMVIKEKNIDFLEMLELFSDEDKNKNNKKENIDYNEN